MKDDTQRNGGDPVSSPAKLTRKQEAWLNFYLETWNATEAARRAGYKYPNVQGPRLYVKVSNLIKERMSEMAMTADEVLKRLSDMGRVSIADFIRTANMPLFDREGNVTGTMQVIELDWDYIKDHGHLVKSITSTQYGPKIELHDGQAALVHLGKHLQLFKEQVEHTGEVTIKVQYADGIDSNPTEATS